MFRFVSQHCLPSTLRLFPYCVFLSIVSSDIFMKMYTENALMLMQASLLQTKDKINMSIERIELSVAGKEILKANCITSWEELLRDQNQNRPLYRCYFPT